MIYNQVIDDDEPTQVKTSNGIKNKNYIFRMLVILVIAFIASPISISSNIYPAGYAMLAVASVFNIPLLASALASIASMLLFKVSIRKYCIIYRGIYSLFLYNSTS